jgi:hypothetical protein
MIKGTYNLRSQKKSLTEMSQDKLIFFTPAKHTYNQYMSNLLGNFGAPVKHTTKRQPFDNDVKKVCKVLDFISSVNH